ncbi:MAG: hypothetical protein A2Y93_18080 [Chloroflexi bacterium RBG_13_68_17]|nr:MAG: hypothetical protein A2Y93_18080 [Chloroflexi bacterium RBG_13_68_17]
MRSQILVVDANPIFAGLVRQTLEETGRYQVVAAARGQDAIDIARRTDIHLAIVDLDLPDLPGLEVMRRIRSLRPDLILVAVPIGGELDAAERARLQIHDVLTKPFYLPELAQKMDAALGMPAESPPTVAESLWPAVEAASAEAPYSAADELAAAIEAAIPGELFEPAPVSQPVAAVPSRPAPPGAPAMAGPPWLSDIERAAQYLTRLSLETSAEAAMLTRGGTLWAYAGHLARQQLDDLIGLVADFWASEGARGAVARFVRLPDASADYMLYATAVTGDIVLSLLFSSETPFSMIRRQAQALARALSQVDPAQSAVSPTTDGGLQDLRLGPPSEWLAESSMPTPELPLLDDLVFPPPDPGEALEAPAALEAETEPQVPIPTDWVPSVPRPAAHMPFLDEIDSGPAALAADGLEEPEGPLPEARYQLEFTAVLVPRFPDHRLTGQLAQDLHDWVTRLCIAWGWRADAVDIQPDYLCLTVTLTPEVAPSRAVHRLRQDLSDRILEAYPGVTTDLPSGRFWARGYLLSAGTQVSPDHIRAFLAETRRSQGLGS